MLNNLNTFYEDPRHRGMLLDILQKKNGISLRNIEFFCTQFAKKHNTTYRTTDDRVLNVHAAYKSSLSGFSKGLFDPFCRGPDAKITYEVPGTGEKINTTLAQLNFMRFAIKNNVVDYLLNHKEVLAKN